MKHQTNIRPFYIYAGFIQNLYSRFFDQYLYLYSNYQKNIHQTGNYVFVHTIFMKLLFLNYNQIILNKILLYSLMFLSYIYTLVQNVYTKLIPIC